MFEPKGQRLCDAQMGLLAAVRSGLEKGKRRVVRGGAGIQRLCPQLQRAVGPKARLGECLFIFGQTKLRDWKLVC